MTATTRATAANGAGEKSRIGLCGLAVMGQNLALNVAEKGFDISVYNRSSDKTDVCVERAKKEGLGAKLRGYHEMKDFVASLAKPRCVIILVKAGAQKTDGYQISQSLLLDDDSQFLSKPELEIYADDVACSHGSTSGAIDAQALFYLRSRGVPEAQAMDLLTLSFVAEAIEEIEDADLAQDILDHLTETLSAR